jgi:hypothetical protein
MSTTEPPSLRVPWDTLLGTKSNVRVLRVLEQAREPMTVRELARRAGEHLRAVQIAANRLVEGGLVERVGTGARQHVRLNVAHPLIPALETLFAAERAWLDRIIRELRAAARRLAGRATAVWVAEGGAPEGTQLEVGVLGSSSDVHELTDAIRSAVAGIIRRENVHIEVRGWTRPDLKAMQGAKLLETRPAILLAGSLPEELRDAAWHTREGTRSHAAVDEALRARAMRVVEALKRRPELIRIALEEVAGRLESAQPQEARTLREWQEVLGSMNVTQLSRWLVAKGDRAARLRQSMPVTFLRAADAAPGSRRRQQ